MKAREVVTPSVSFLYDWTTGTFHGNVLNTNSRTFSLRRTFLWNVRLDLYDVTQLRIWACAVAVLTRTRASHVRVYSSHTDGNKMVARVGGEIENGGGE